MPQRKTKWANYWVQKLVTVGTLNNATAIAELVGETFKEPVHWIKVRFGHVQVASLQAADGPFLFGISNSEVGIAEIKAALEVTPDSSRHDDQVAIASRLRNIAVLGVLGNEPSTAVDNQTVFKDLENKEVNLRVPDDGDILCWVYNSSGATIATNALVLFSFQLLGRWLD